MLEKLFGISPLFWLFVKAPGHKVLESGRPLLVLKPRGVLCHNQVKDLLLGLTDVRRLAISQLKGKDAKAPYVHFDIVLGLTLNELWSHPANCPYLT